MYVSYRDKIQFLLVYITEAHPEQLAEKSVMGITGDPNNMGERAILATQCVSELKLSLPTLLDTMGGIANDAYNVGSVRICILEIDGNIAYIGKRGPRGFKPKEAREVLKKIIAGDGRLPD